MVIGKSIVTDILRRFRISLCKQSEILALCGTIWPVPSGIRTTWHQDHPNVRVSEQVSAQLKVGLPILLDSYNEVKHVCISQITHSGPTTGPFVRFDPLTSKSRKFAPSGPILKNSTVLES